MPALLETKSPIFDLIGSGISFEFTFSATGKVGETPANQTAKKITENLRLLLSTTPGERYNNPEFGSELPSLLFEPNDDILKDRAFVAISESIAKWEPRIVVEAIGFPSRDETFDPSGTGGADIDKTLRVLIVYRLRGSLEKGSALLSFDTE